MMLYILKGRKSKYCSKVEQHVKILLNLCILVDPSHSALAQRAEPQVPQDRSMKCEKPWDKAQRPRHIHGKNWHIYGVQSHEKMSAELVGMSNV